MDQSYLLLYKSNWFNENLTHLRPVGQMALNYLMQSLICGILFNGFGFALFGRLQRYEVYVVVLLIWLFRIIFALYSIIFYTDP
ncbi:MAG: DUF418 domain-containing protein [Cytophagales bacterium]|nr:DUF418 domain-containing protein [Cytophagales bacterium]